MGAYLDRLNAEFDELTAGIDTILNRAADEGREITEDENKLVERDQTRAEDLKKAIEHHTGIEEMRAKVEITRSKVPAAASTPKRQSTQVTEPAAEKLEDLFPTVGHYIQTVHRATQEGDKYAIELLERAATAHQTIADNPGIIPRPILGPVISLLEPERPFVTAIGARPLPAGSFDRPKVTQNVAVGRQENEKDLTESRQMKIDKKPVSSVTIAGHLNISRQDIKWSNPGILTLVAEDFVNAYAMESNDFAVGEFEASIADAPATSLALDGEAIRRQILRVTAEILALRKPGGRPDAVFLSGDVWAALASLLTPLGTPVFPGLDLLGGEGGLLGRRAIVDPFFAPGTFAVGPSRLLEYYEDVDGLVSVEEPNVLGQLVGYAGYPAFLNVGPELFRKITLPPEEVEAAAAAAADKPAPKAASAK